MYFITHGQLIAGAPGIKISKYQHYPFLLVYLKLLSLSLSEDSLLWMSDFIFSEGIFFFFLKKEQIVTIGILLNWYLIY